MKGLIAKRERIVRARRVQHLLATVESARAQNEAMALEQNAQRVRMVRDALFEVRAITSGAALAPHRELAGRLEQAGRHMVGAIDGAPKRVVQKEGERSLDNHDAAKAQKKKQK